MLITSYSLQKGVSSIGFDYIQQSPTLNEPWLLEPTILDGLAPRSTVGQALRMKQIQEGKNSSMSALGNLGLEFPHW